MNTNNNNKSSNMLSAISGGLGAIGDIVSGVLNNRAQAKAQQREHAFQQQLQDDQFAHDMEMSKYQYETNLEMWNQENAYNSPAEQMKRYQEAGLNPNLLYGNITSGNSTGTPSYQSPRKDFSGLMGINQRVKNFDYIRDLSTSFMSMMHSVEDLQLKKSQKSNLDTRTENEAFKRSIMEIDKEIKRLEKDAKRNKNTFDLDKHQEWKDLKQSRANIMKYRAETLEYQSKIQKIKSENAERGIDDNPESLAALINNTANQAAYRATGSRFNSLHPSDMGKFYNQLINDFTNAIKGMFSIKMPKLFD